MPFIALFFLLVILGVVTTGLAFRLKNKFPHQFLVYFFYFILFFNIYGFLKITGKVFIRILDGSPPDLYPSFKFVLPILYAPAVGLYMYMLFRWIWELMDKKMTRMLEGLFWSLQAAAFGFYLIGIIQYSKTLDSAGLFIAIRDSILIPLLISPLLYLLIKLSSMKNLARKRLLLNMGLYYLAGFILYFMIIFARFPLYEDANAYYGITTFAHFFLHLPPLIYLGWLLNQHGRDLVLPVRESEKRGIELSFLKYGITEREQAIVRLIMQGKSNAEIGKELFIATKTVKNNIFNIYRKTGAKNRVQLTNLLRGS